MPDDDLRVPDFSKALRGYDRQQVDDYIVRLSTELVDIHARALAAERRIATRTDGGSFDDLGLHVAGVLQHASQEADRLRAEAQAEADRIHARLATEDVSAGARRDALLAEARNRADQLLSRVQAYADQRAEDTLGELENEAEDLRAEVNRLRAEKRQAAMQVDALVGRLTAAVGDRAVGDTVVEDVAVRDVAVRDVAVDAEPEPMAQPEPKTTFGSTATEPEAQSAAESTAEAVRVPHSAPRAERASSGRRPSPVAARRSAEPLHDDEVQR